MALRFGSGERFKDSPEFSPGKLYAKACLSSRLKRKQQACQLAEGLGSILHDLEDVFQVVQTHSRTHFRFKVLCKPLPS